MKQKLGAIVYDLPRLLWASRPFARAGWVHFRNRSERLIPAQSGSGVQCDWQWSNELHITKVFPFLGRLFMKRVLREWPVKFQTDPNRQDGEIEVSFVIGHRGIQRLPHLLMTLQTVAAQASATFECIVVEQSATSEVKDQLPSWVRYVHTPLPDPDMPYCRSWALNVGAGLAAGKLLVLHDNDMLVPTDYAALIMKQVRQGYDVVNLKRFIFYLGESHTRSILSGKTGLTAEAPLSVVQNLEAGGSISITRKAYDQIGGMDESFIGWGGEDNEFWERAQTLRVWHYAYLPMIHLWHDAQPGKHQPDNNTQQHYKRLSAIPATTRIAQLRSSSAGAIFCRSGSQRSDG